MSKVRELKGKSLVEFPDNYCVIDLETTGLSPDYDSIIEMAAIKIVNNKIDSQYSVLVNPGFQIDDFITELTGISNDMLKDAPKLEDVIDEFLSFIGDDIVIGHNVNFDVNFIYDDSLWLNRSPFSNNYVDTMRIFRKLYPNLHHHRLCDLLELYDIKATQSHRALEDCYDTINAFNDMKSDIILKYGTFEDFKKLFKIIRKPKFTKEFFENLKPESEPDLDSLIYNKVCVFTGKLERFTREEAYQIVTNIGGIPENTVTKKTSFLVLGNTDYSTNIKDGKSNKQKTAEKYQLQGYDIQIMPEEVFYQIIEEE